MNVKAKIENPVCIRLGNTENIVLADEKYSQNDPLDPGVMFGGHRYGFVLITDANGRQKEVIYPTQCRIVAAGTENGCLKVFEDNKKQPWVFNKKGKVIHLAFNDFTDEYKRGFKEERKFEMLVDNYDMFNPKPMLKNPLNIKISLEFPELSKILKDDLVQKDYPLYPGVVLGTEHYGFNLIIETENGEKVFPCPTENRLYGLSTEGNEYDWKDISIYEDGKYHPWVISIRDGKLKKQAAYNKYSKRDKTYFEEVYDLNPKVSRCNLLKVKK